ncbi:adventurous gliding motility protein AgmC [Pyxidicoccus xibeiensis]|uniref:adventurous gliding motility protein AgmC n=1 Tax=Pyxidicoccus xibeiensis TaxID=2906759 RepID=UPI0020A71515|nr:Ig-like domain-containing protein [Pyxidicoccus xibeiensis]MCP3144831.1 Ig-like domain-containing protein [Pyxidicoccus xibeiensis]
MRTSLTHAWAVGALLLATVAAAEPDSFGLGSGRDGALNVTSAGVKVNAAARVTSALGAGATSIPVASTAGFGNGDLVLVLQALGTGGADVSVAGERRGQPAGRWELARVATVSSRTLNLTRPLVEFFEAQGTQVLRVPEYTDVTIARGGSLVAEPWNGETGGVVVFLATGTVKNQGLIDARGAGFRGGAYVRDWSNAAGCGTLSLVGPGGAQRGESVAPAMNALPLVTGRDNDANGGGGGVCRQSGGGGGGHGGVGGQGGRTAPDDGARDVGGLGGAVSGQSLQERLTFGGGGGAGHGLADPPGPDGGRGGGIIFVRASRLVGGGRLDASGEAGGSSINDGAGGGGAGGSIAVRVAGTASCGELLAQGGRGGDSTGRALRAPGGGGGGGRVLLQAETGSSCEARVAPGLAGGAVDGGSNGATPTAVDDKRFQGVVERLEGGFRVPPAPVLVLPAEGALLPTAQPLFSGTARPGDEVIVFVNGDALGRTRADATGAWAFVPDVRLAETPHRASAVVVESGAQGPRTEERMFSVDVTAPETSVGRAQGLSSFGEATLEFSATEPGVTYQCSVDRGPFNPCRPPYRMTGLADGRHTLRVRARDGAGNVDLSPAVFDFDPNAVPGVPVITAPTNRAVLTDATPTINGTTENNSTVRIYIDDSFVAQVDETGGGNWTFTPTTALAQGAHSVRATATNLDGTSVSTAARLFSVDSEIPPTPAVTFPSPSQTLNTATPTFKGTFTAPDPGIRVLLSISGAAEVEAQLEPSGNWSYTPTADLAQGARTLVVRAVDVAGNASPPTTSRSFTIDSVAPPVPVLLTPASGALLTTLRPVYSGTLGTGATTVEVYVDDVRVSGTPTVSGSNWTLTQPTDLTQELHWVRVLAKDAAGNASAFSATHTFTIDRTAPGAPVVIAPMSSVPLNTTVVTVRGTAEAGSIVSITLDTQPQGTAVVNAQQVWSFVIPQSVSEATHTLVAQARDAAGNASGDTTVSFSVDVTPPQTTISASPPNPSSDTTPTFTFTSEAGARFECSLDGGNYGNCSASYTLTVAEGQRTLLVRAVDNANNVDPTPAVHTWRVDTTAPAVPAIDEPDDDDFVNTATPLITGTGEVGATIVVRIDNTDQATTPVVDSAGSWQLRLATALTPGGHNVRARARDAASNESADSITHDFTVDTSVPVTSIDTGPEPQTNLLNASFDLSASESPVTYECSLDGAAFAACSDPHVITVSEGAHVMRVRAKDRADNTDATPAEHRWSVDQSPVSTFIEAGPASITNDPVAVFRFASNKSGVTFRCVLNNGTEFTCPANYSVTVDDRPHRLEVVAVDGAGNRDASAAVAIWVVDTGTPSAPAITVPATNGTRSTLNTPTIEGTAEANSYVTVILGGVEQPEKPVGANGSWTFTFAPLTDGTYSVTARVRDAAGNVSAVSGVRTFIVDTNSPETSIVSGPGTLTRETLATFVLDSNDDAALFEVKLDAETVFRRVLTPYAVTVGQGQHSLTVRAVDETGNVDPTPEIYTWFVDSVAPDIQFTSTPVRTPGGRTNNLTATFGFGSNEPAVVFACSLDGSAFATCPSPPNFAVTDGDHTLVVRGTDTTGNQSADISFNWTVDSNLPGTELLASPPGLTKSSSATFRFSTNKDNVTFECDLDGRGFARCGNVVDAANRISEAVFSGLTDGAHTLQVQAVDNLGNAGSPTDLFRWTVDLLTPETTLSRGPDAMVSTPEVSFEVQTEQGATLYCSFDNVTYDVCPAPLTFTLQDGAYTLYLRSRDAALNDDPTPAESRWTIDTLAPAIPEMLTPAEGQLTNVGRPVFSGTAEPNSGVVLFLNGTRVQSIDVDSAGKWSFEPAQNLGDGDYEVQLFGVDVAKNTSETSEPRHFTVDTDAPETRVDEKPGVRIRLGRAAFRFSSDEPDVKFECGFNGEDYVDCSATPVYDELLQGTYTLKVRAVDVAGNRDGSPEVISWRVYLGEDMRTKGGGLSCATAGGEGGSALALLGLGGLALLASRRRRRC